MPQLDNQPACYGIRIEGLTVAFDNNAPVLHDVSLQVEPGQIVALVGASGCGKTTLLRSVAGLNKPQSGRVSLQGPSDTDPAATVGDSKEVSFVFQQPTLLQWRDVQANIRLPLELQRGVSGEAAAKVEKALSSVGLAPSDATKYPSELSGGMQMRASLARAIVTDPSILLLDEPFAALDDLLRTRMNELLLDMHSRRPRTVVLVTHNIAEAVFLSDRIAIMGRGRIATVLDNQLSSPRSDDQRGNLEFAQVFSEVSQALREAGK
ncbi:MAG: ABC transporter ATP-binding protein [Aureliella sp.]